MSVQHASRISPLPTYARCGNNSNNNEMTHEFSELWAVVALCLTAFALPIIEIYFKLDVTAPVLITPTTPARLANSRYVAK